jgi:hypothetical protein
MYVVEGAFYETRNNQIVGPMKRTKYGFSAHNGKINFTWHTDGIAARGTLNPGDLIKCIERKT